eukprot:CAMPEP_0170465600 /NCGR_PEP_ID=MMETSP0123-20130129/9888_1 /TAXON_ID=182087 /ORGANISM="Favella ehrenbergii, Strain Fehren 1" /LENGTH=68 /DNA_ID=CAMNT_0010731547 /DNA_START=470 /DNA_END=676 /DNA_ORIENTATION=+
MPDVYFWLMGEILFFYCLSVGIVCYFFRRFCQDPKLRKQQADEEECMGKAMENWRRSQSGFEMAPTKN